MHLIANGDHRQSANVVCWPAQQEFERKLCTAFEKLGTEVRRAHPVDPVRGHGFIASQAEGLRVLSGVEADAPVVVAEGVWQFSQQVLGGLLRHRGRILTVANWEGQWPGLVGLLNMNASLRKAGRS
ncbi:MAG TPA: fucose isomerase, partial [Anaerolineae bacterium]